MFRYTCPHCSTVLEYGEDLTGRKVECGGCGGKFVVEAATPLVPEPEPAPAPAPASEPKAQSAAVGGKRSTLNASGRRRSVASGKKKAGPKGPIIALIVAVAFCAAFAFFLILEKNRKASSSSRCVQKKVVAEQEAVASGGETKRSTPGGVEPASARVAPQAEESQRFTLKGKLVGWKHATARPDLLRFKLVGYKDDGGGSLQLPSAGVAIEDVDLSGFVDAYVTMALMGRYDETGSKIRTDRIVKVERLAGAELQAYLGAIERVAAREFDTSPNALPFSGTWGPRMSIPSAMQPDDVEHFNVAQFVAQISRLTSASYVMVNVTQPAHGNYFTGPHPELAKVLKLSKPAFPARDILGEVLAGIEKTGKKALVYFAAEGFHAHGNEESRAAWDRHVKALGMTHDDATGELLVGYYAERYGRRIHGWWFDGSNGLDAKERLLWRKLVRAGNPDSIVVFNRMAGPPYRSTAQCDYFGGHPTPRSKHKFWDMINLPMIEAIEAGPWMDPDGKPVDDPGNGAMGHVFMGMQDRWNFGKCAFPPAQAIEWTTRVVGAGGMYTWHAPRTGSRMAGGQFRLLLKINDAVEKLPHLSPE